MSHSLDHEVPTVRCPASEGRAGETDRRRARTRRRLKAALIGSLALVLAPPTAALAAPKRATATVTITAGPAAGGATNSTSASFSFTANRSGATFQCSLDAGSYAACSSPKSYSGLADGSHTFRVLAVLNGSNGSPSSRSWTVDSTKPSAPASLAGTPGEAQASLSWNGAADNMGVAGYRVYRNGSQASQTATTAYTDTGLTAGSNYSYYVVAYDSAGNVSAASNTTTVTPTAPTTTTKPIYWGALIGTQFTGLQPPWDWSAIPAFEQRNSGGKKLSVLHWGAQWHSPTHCGGYCPFSPSVFTTVRNNGVIPFYSWGSTSETATTGYTNAQIAGGSQDAYITQWAQAAKAWGKPFFLRYNWEMNGNWYPFSAGWAGNTAAGYVANWRHVHDIFTSVGATNVNWVWCPNIDPQNSMTSLASLYPGDAYVDWTCLDGYNMNAPWKSFTDLFRSTYDNITGTIAPSKPMIVGETGSTETGGNKAQWITEMLSSLPVNFPKIRGVLWYDRPDYMNGYSDWQIESSTASSNAFAAGIQSSTYTVNSYSGLTASPIPPPA